MKAAVMKYGKNQWSRIASLLHRSVAIFSYQKNFIICLITSLFLKKLLICQNWFFTHYKKIKDPPVFIGGFPIF